MSTITNESPAYMGVDYVAHKCREERDWNVIVWRSPMHLTSKTRLVRGFNIVLEPHVPQYASAADFILDSLVYLRMALEFAETEYANCGTKTLKVWLIASVALDHINSCEQKVSTIGANSAELLLCASHLATELTKETTNAMPIEGLCLRIEGV